MKNSKTKTLLIDMKQARKFRKENPYIPVVKNIDKKILKKIESGCNLNMKEWHTCETSHCLAGWAIVLAGKKGLNLEFEFGAPRAASDIYQASIGVVPDFYAQDGEAMDGLLNRAKLQKER